MQEINSKRKHMVLLSTHYKKGFLSVDETFHAYCSKHVQNFPCIL